MSLAEWHVGRSWGDWPGDLEKECGCPKAPCGFVLLNSATCRQHRPAGGQTLRHIHRADVCEEVTKRRTVARNRPGIERAMDIVTSWEGGFIEEEAPGWLLPRIDELQALLQKELNA